MPQPQPHDSFTIHRHRPVPSPPARWNLNRLQDGGNFLAREYMQHTAARSRPQRSACRRWVPQRHRSASQAGGALPAAYQGRGLREAGGRVHNVRPCGSSCRKACGAPSGIRSMRSADRAPSTSRQPTPQQRSTALPPSPELLLIGALQAVLGLNQAGGDGQHQHGSQGLVAHRGGEDWGGAGAGRQGGMSQPRRTCC